MLDGQGADEILAGYDRYYTPFLKNQLRQLKFKNFFNELKYYFYYNKVSKVKELLKFIVPSKLISKANYRSFKALGFQGPFIKKDYNRFKSIKSLSIDQVKYSNLPALLHYEDRNSMTYSIEARVPFFDYRIVEYAVSLNDNQKIMGGKRKIF